jgi:hypothetical protein
MNKKIITNIQFWIFPDLFPFDYFPMSPCANVCMCIQKIMLNNAQPTKMVLLWVFDFPPICTSHLKLTFYPKMQMGLKWCDSQKKRWSPAKSYTHESRLFTTKQKPQMPWLCQTSRRSSFQWEREREEKYKRFGHFFNFN